jgi:hypothetical protein
LAVKQIGFVQKLMLNYWREEKLTATCIGADHNHTEVKFEGGDFGVKKIGAKRIGGGKS